MQKLIILTFFSLFIHTLSANAAEPSAEIFLQLGHSSNVNSVSYSPDGKFIASGSYDETVKIWDAGTGKLLRTLSDHPSDILSVNYSPDGKFIASMGYDSTVKIWEAGTGKLVRTLSDHFYWVRSVNYSPDGKFIASGSSDNTVKIWDVGTGELIRTLSGHSSRVRSVNYSPDGKFIAFGSTSAASGSSVPNALAALTRTCISLSGSPILPSDPAAFQRTASFLSLRTSVSETLKVFKQLHGEICILHQ